MKDMKHEVKREKLKVQMIILAALTAVFIMMLPSPVMAFYYEAIPDDVAPLGFQITESADVSYSERADCLVEGGKRVFRVEDREGDEYYATIYVIIGETDDVNCAMNLITGGRIFGWDYYKNEAREESCKEGGGMKFWEDELTSLFGHPAAHYAYERTHATPSTHDYFIGSGGSQSIWFSGKTFKWVVIWTGGSGDPPMNYDNFREDILYPTLEKVEKIKVPTKLSPTEEPAETTPAPTTAPTTAPSSTTGTAKVYVNNEWHKELHIYLYIDDHFEDFEDVPAGSSNYHFGDYELSSGYHTFKIEWTDYESGEDYEAEATEYISAGETTTMTLTAEKREVVAPTTVPAEVELTPEPTLTPIPEEPVETPTSVPMDIVVTLPDVITIEPGAKKSVYYEIKNKGSTTKKYSYYAIIDDISIALLSGEKVTTHPLRSYCG